MILARIKQEESSHPSIEPKHTFNTTHKNAFRATNFILRKRHTLNHNPEQSPQSKHMTKSPDPRPTDLQSTSPIVERTCSKFMKNYVDKLKKQRKREKKRLSQINHHKHIERQSSLGCEISPLPLIHHGKQQILIFEKINPNTFRSAIIQHIPSADALEKQKIQEIISQIKLHKENNQRKSLKKRNQQGLPDLHNKIKPRKASFLKSIGDLDPWEHEIGHSHDIFQELK